MNVPEYIKLAKRVLKEDAGSEGMTYLVQAKSGLAAIDTQVVKIEDVKDENDVTKATVTFAYPHDYGCALNAVKEALPGIEIISLSLVY